jgi:spore coat polysaccharide biosynthesis predicted glycosyltransferase SpsG
MRRIVFVCDSDLKSCHGHVARTLALANILKRKIKANIFFIIRDDCGDSIRNAGFVTFSPKKNLYDQLMGLGAEMVIFDKENSDSSMIQALMSDGVKTVNTCYFDKNIGVCDINLVPYDIITQDARLCVGPKCVLVNGEFYKGHNKIKRKVKQVFVQLRKDESREKVRKSLKNLNVSVISLFDEEQPLNDEEFSRMIRKYDLIITHMTYLLFVYMSMGIPVVLLSEDQKENISSVFVDGSYVYYLGSINELEDLTLQRRLKRIFKGIAKRKRLRYYSTSKYNKSSEEYVYNIIKRLLDPKNDS